MTKEIKSYNFIFDYNMFVNDVRACLEAHDLRMHELDDMAGLGRGNTANLLNGQRNQKMETWLSLANAMDIDVRTYFVLDV